jgi:hypothetical protein
VVGTGPAGAAEHKRWHELTTGCHHRVGLTQWMNTHCHSSSRSSSSSSSSSSRGRPSSCSSSQGIDKVSACILRTPTGQSKCLHVMQWSTDGSFCSMCLVPLDCCLRLFCLLLLDTLPTHSHLCGLLPFPCLCMPSCSSEVLPPVQVGTPPFDFPFKLAGYTDVDPNDFVYAKTPGTGQCAAAGHSDTASSKVVSPCFAYSSLWVCGQMAAISAHSISRGARCERKMLHCSD